MKLRVIMGGMVMVAVIYSSLGAADAVSQADPNTMAVNIFNNNNHTIELGAGRKDGCNCIGLYGKQFKNCMAYIKLECFKKNLNELGSRGRNQYVQDLSRQETLQLLNSFTTAQWQELNKECPSFVVAVRSRVVLWQEHDRMRQARAAQAYTNFLIGLLYVACQY